MKLSLLGILAVLSLVACSKNDSKEKTVAQANTDSDATTGSEASKVRSRILQVSGCEFFYAGEEVDPVIPGQDTLTCLKVNFKSKVSIDQTREKILLLEKEMFARRDSASLPPEHLDLYRSISVKLSEMNSTLEYRSQRIGILLEKLNRDWKSLIAKSSCFWVPNVGLECDTKCWNRDEQRVLNRQILEIIAFRMEHVEISDDDILFGYEFQLEAHNELIDRLLTEAQGNVCFSTSVSSEN